MHEKSCWFLSKLLFSLVFRNSEYQTEIFAYNQILLDWTVFRSFYVLFLFCFLKKTFSSILVHTTFFYYPNQLTMHTFYRVYLFHSRIISWRWSAQRDFSFSLLSATFFFGILLFALFVLLLIGSSLSASSSSLLLHSYSFWITIGWVATLPLLTYILFRADFFSLLKHIYS